MYFIMIKINTILIVVVLYKCRFEDAKSIKTLSDSLAFDCGEKLELVVYDNSPQYNPEPLWHTLFNIHYIPDYSNSGVSKAYNTAFEIGKKMNKQYLLLLDQDTEIPLMYCKKLGIISDHNQLVMPKLENRGTIISPCRYMFGRGTALRNMKDIEGVLSLKHRNFLNSGSLISLSLYEIVGGFNENIPLYFSDFNFYNRVKKYISSYYQMNIIFHHNMSSNDETNLEQFAIRFELYCDGAYVCFQSFWGITLMIFNVMMRSIKVGIKFRTFRFMNIALKRFYNFILINM